MSGPGFGGGQSAGQNGYRFQDIDALDPDYVYVGYEHPRGQWFIYRRDLDSGAREYATGSSSYPTNWTGRAGLPYA